MASLPAQNDLPFLTPFLHFVWNNSAFYRRLYLAHGIRQADLDALSLADLPLVNKRLILENFAEVVTDPRLRSAEIEEWLEHDHDPRSRYLNEFVVIHSSGSSGIQASSIYDESAWRRMSAAAAAHIGAGQPSGPVRTRSAYFVGSGHHIASVTAALNSAQAGLDCLILTLADPLEETIARLNAFQPERLTSYASCLGWLAELALAGQLKIRPRELVSSSDRMTPAIEAAIRQAWNPHIYDLYAACESLFMAVKGPGQAQWQVLEDLQRIEILDEQNRPVAAGQTGQAVLTNWNNRVLPLIRYEMTDYLVCGDPRPGQARIAGFAGRTFDALPIRLESGQPGRIPSYALAQFGLPGLKAFQFITHSPDLADLEYVSDQGLDEEVGCAAARLLAEWGGGRTTCRPRRVDHIWNDAGSLKLKFVRRADAPQVGLPAHCFSAPAQPAPAACLRPGGGFVPFPRQNLESSLAALFEHQVQRAPQALALKDGPFSLSYTELNQAANRVARALLQHPLDPARPVALLFGHQARMVMALLGVLKAGGWYLPLDPAHPAGRSTASLAQAGARLVLTSAEGLPAARACGFGAEHIINLDDLSETGAEANPALEIPPDAPACVLFTSGTTGQPKGVVLDQQAVAHRAMLYTNDYAIGPADRLALLQSYVFNASLREIFAALLNGAGLYIFSPKSQGLHRLAGWLEQESITTLYLVPSVFRLFLETLSGQRFEALRFIRLGGEAVLARDVQGFQDHFGPGCLLANGLAATETGTFCQDFLDHNSRLVGPGAPAGFPVLEKEIRLLDEAGCPAADGTPGEIVVTSAYFGPGSLVPGPDGPGFAAAQPGRLRTIFTGDLAYRLPSTGKLVLTGRKDWQVKLRGQRMNLLEIEQALLSLENVAAAAVTFQAGPDGADFLAAYIQPAAQPFPAEADLRRALAARLPAAMVPAVLLFFEALPCTPGGKVDRQALPAAPSRPLPPASRPAPAQLPPTAQALAEIWSDLLAVSQVQADDRFFALGGDSLQASALMARIAARFGINLPLSILFQHETLAELADVIAAGTSPAPTGPLVSIRPGAAGQGPVFFFPGMPGEVVGLQPLTARLGGQRPLFGLENIDYGRPPDHLLTIEQAASRYAAEIRSVHPAGPCILAGYSFGGNLALETARQLAEPGKPLPLVVLIDTTPPVPPRNASLVNRIRIHWANLRKLGGLAEAAAYLRGGLLRFYVRLFGRKQTRAIVRQIRPADLTPAQAAKMALGLYRPAPYPGRVLLFKASQRQWYVDWDPLAAWETLIGGRLETRTVPGEHFSLLKEPSVAELARQFNQVLDQELVVDG